MEIVTFPKIILVCTLFYQKYLFNYGPFPASRSSFRPFLFTIQIKMKMRRYAHGKQTRDHGMVGIDGSTELWRPTKNIFALFNNAPIINVVTNTCVSFWNFQLRGPTLLLRFKLRRRLKMIFGKIFLAIILVLAVQVINGSDEDDAKDRQISKLNYHLT